MNARMLDAIIQLIEYLNYSFYYEFYVILKLML